MPIDILLSVGSEAERTGVIEDAELVRRILVQGRMREEVECGGGELRFGVGWWRRIKITDQ